MVDRAELRRLAEWAIRAKNANGSRTAFHTAASPDVVLGLLEEIDAQEQAAIATEESVHRLGEERDQAQDDFHQAMELVRKYAAECEEIRAVAVRLRDALLSCFAWIDGSETERYEPQCVVTATQVRSILADPEVEKL